MLDPIWHPEHGKKESLHCNDRVHQSLRVFLVNADCRLTRKKQMRIADHNVVLSQLPWFVCRFVKDKISIQRKLPRNIENNK